VKQLYRFATKRLDGAADTTVLDSLASAYTTQAQNMAGLVTGVAQSEAFLNRLNDQ